MTPEEAALALKLVLIEDLCPFCHGTGLIRDVPEDGETMTVPCAECRGTGRVPWLKGVRVKCPICKGKGHTIEPPSGSGQFGPDATARYTCIICQGRGWVVSKRLEDWLEAASTIGVVSFMWAGEKNPLQRRCWIDEGPVQGAETFLEALQLALEKVRP